MRLVSPWSWFRLRPEWIDGIIQAAPWLLLGGLAVAVLSPLWGGAGVISAAALAWIAAQHLMLIDWRESGGARVRCGAFLLATGFLVYLFLSSLSEQPTWALRIDIAASGIILLAHCRLLIAAMFGDGEGRSTELPSAEEIRSPRPSYPGNEGIKSHQEGVTSPPAIPSEEAGEPGE